MNPTPGGRAPPGHPSSHHMGRPPFTPTEAEARAMRGAERMWREYYTEPDGSQMQRLDLTPLTVLKMAVKDMQIALGPFGYGRATDQRLREGLLLQLALLDRKRDSAVTIQGMFVALNRLDMICKRWAPKPGAIQNPRETRFIMYAADVWVVAFNVLPTYNGRFHKTIVQVASPPLCDLTPDRVAAGLRIWRKSIRGNKFREGITAGLLPSA